MAELEVSDLTYSLYFYLTGITTSWYLFLFCSQWIPCMLQALKKRNFSYVVWLVFCFC